MLGKLSFPKPWLQGPKPAHTKAYDFVHEPNPPVSLVFVLLMLLDPEYFVSFLMFIIFIFFFSVSFWGGMEIMGIEPRALNLLGRCYTT